MLFILEPKGVPELRPLIPYSSTPPILKFKCECEYNKIIWSGTIMAQKCSSKSHETVHLYIYSNGKILLRGIQLTHVQRYWGSTVKMVFSFKVCTFHEANTCVTLPNAWWCSVRALSYCYHNNNGSQSAAFKNRWTYVSCIPRSSLLLHHHTYRTNEPAVTSAYVHIVQTSLLLHRHTYRTNEPAVTSSYISYKRACCYIIIHIGQTSLLSNQPAYRTNQPDRKRACCQLSQHIGYPDDPSPNDPSP
jgi:hypothetical protein